MKKTIIAGAVLALTTACGGETGDSEANNGATAANAAADHDEAVPTPAAEENHGHEHDGNEAEHSH